MEKVFLYGASKTGKCAIEEIGNERVQGFIDYYKAGSEFCSKKVISLEEYVDSGCENEIIICSHKWLEIIEKLNDYGISNYSVYRKIYMHDDVPMSNNISHDKWIYKLQELADYPRHEILEIGSRVVTGANFRSFFKNANYTGFDLYEGENVDVVGDAHRLGEYFDKKFDLIFCSAVFEHFAMPWLVADEMINLCKEGGYIFVETHYSYSSHERPWHFFQFSENALKVLFSEKRGIECIEAGCSNPIIGLFAEEASDYLKGKEVSGLYCHSEFLGRKKKTIALDWNNCIGDSSIGMYPKGN